VKALGVRLIPAIILRLEQKHLQSPHRNFNHANLCHLFHLNVFVVNSLKFMSKYSLVNTCKTYAQCFKILISGDPLAGPALKPSHDFVCCETSNMRGVRFGTLCQLYFQENSSPYIIHGTDTIVTPNDTGEIQIVPDH
jgi:hypothetical protein